MKVYFVVAAFFALFFFEMTMKVYFAVVDFFASFFLERL